MAASTEYNAELKEWNGPEFKFADPAISFGQTLLDRLEKHGDKIMQVTYSSESVVQAA